jgi:hypothetical protein
LPWTESGRACAPGGKSDARAKGKEEGKPAPCLRASICGIASATINFIILAVAVAVVAVAVVAVVVVTSRE